MRIVDVKAFPISVPIPPERSNRVGIGRMVKRDAVIVKVTTDDGIVGYGESHHARNPGAVANLVNTTMRDLVLGMDATDTVSVWSKVYRAQIGSHGMGAGSVIALSGVDMALWDARGKGRGLAALQAARRQRARHSGLCRRRRLARFQYAGSHRGRGRRFRRDGLPRRQDQARPGP